tara:strand:+ start:6345 stop:7466 length:1122 start_codon:yes stop_codon:yes gene_type:complete
MCDNIIVNSENKNGNSIIYKEIDEKNKKLEIKKSKEIKYRKKCEKQKRDRPSILKYSDYNLLEMYNYKVCELKEICKKYKLKQSGNKNELKIRIYNYLKFCESVIKIQKIWKKIILNKYNVLHGPAKFNRSLCVNETDFYTMDSLHELEYKQFFSFKENNTIYGFDILSFNTLINNTKKNNYVKNNNEIINPYTRNIIPKEVIFNFNKLINLSKFICSDVILSVEEEPIIDEIKLFENRVRNVFQEIDILGNYTDPNWLFDICNDKFLIIKFLRELADIWMYRAQLSLFTREQICPPYGYPFSLANINFYIIHALNINILKTKLISVIELFVNSGINRDYRCLGANYVLCALTLVNSNTAESLPWLYQSVAIN